MKRISELKTEAKASFKAKYWPAVGIGLLGYVIVGGLSAIPAVGWLLSLLVGTIISVGLVGFYIQVYRGEELKVESLFAPFNRYGRVLGGSLWMYLWLFLWSLIFVIPFVVYFVSMALSAIFSSGDFFMNAANMEMMNGWSNWDWFGALFHPAWLLLFLLLIPMIIKSFSYFCTTFILADSPNVPATSALDISKKITNGFKGKIFLTGLSFILWYLPMIASGILMGLSTLGFGFFVAGVIGYIASGALQVFYVLPYYSTTMAALYQEMKDNAKAKGIEGTELL